MKNNTGKNSIMTFATDTVAAEDITVTEDWKGTRFRKQICKFGEWVNPLFPVETMVLDDAFADEMIANFSLLKENGLLPHVTIPLNHTDDTTMNTGEVVSLDKGIEGEEPGIYATMEIRRWGTTFDIEDGLIFDVSMGFDWNWVDTKDGNEWGIVLEHVALVNNPYLSGMSEFERAPEQIAKDEEQRKLWEDEIGWYDEFSKKHKQSAIMLSKSSAKELLAMKGKKKSTVTLSKVTNDREFDVTIKVKDEAGEDVEHVVAAGAEVEVPEDQAEAVTTQIAEAEAPANDDEVEETDEEREAREAEEAAAAAGTGDDEEEDDAKGEGKNKLSKSERAELSRLRLAQKESDAKSAYATLLSAKKIVPAQEAAFVELHKSLNGQKVKLSRDGKETEVNLSQALVDFMNAGTQKFSTEQTGSKKATTGTADGKKPSELLSEETAKGLAAQGVTAERMDALAEKSPAYREAMSKLNNKEEE